MDNKQPERKKLVMYGMKRQPPNPLWYIQFDFKIELYRVWNTYVKQPDVLLKLLTPPKPPPDPIIIKPNTPPPHPIARTLFPEPSEPTEYPGQIRPKYKMPAIPIQNPNQNQIPNQSPIQNPNKTPPPPPNPSPPNKKHTLTSEEEHLLQLLEQEPFDYETTVFFKI